MNGSFYLLSRAKLDFLIFTLYGDRSSNKLITRHKLKCSKPIFPGNSYFSVPTGFEPVLNNVGPLY